MELAAKLQLKDAMRTRIVGAPKWVDLGLKNPRATDAESFIVFVKNADELRACEEDALDAARADKLTWIAYPKAKQLGTDLNRDILWKLLEGKGVRPVRQVSIDDTWSALRFRPA